MTMDFEAYFRETKAIMAELEKSGSSAGIALEQGIERGANYTKSLNWC